jgi:hypothetical protein
MVTDGNFTHASTVRTIDVLRREAPDRLDQCANHLIRQKGCSENGERETDAACAHILPQGRDQASGGKRGGGWQNCPKRLD